MTKKKTTLKEYSDEQNPEFLFNLTHKQLLLQIVGKEINCIQLAKKALANRGLDSNGKWIGFEKANKHFKL